MQRIFCIENSDDGQGGPHVERGKIYTKTSELMYNNYMYYAVLEIPKERFYLARLFIDLIEDQQDETCFVRDYQTQKV